MIMHLCVNNFECGIDLGIHLDQGQVAVLHGSKTAENWAFTQHSLRD